MVPCSIETVLNMLFGSIYIKLLLRNYRTVYNKNIDFKTITAEIQHLEKILSDSDPKQNYERRENKYFSKIYHNSRY